MKTNQRGSALEIPQALVRHVGNGTAVSFFGAGATCGARLPDNTEPPLGNLLRDRISDRFLPPPTSSEPLAWVSELAISATDLFEVQDFIADQFRDMKPAGFHHLLPTFRWRGLATTN